MEIFVREELYLSRFYLFFEAGDFLCQECNFSLCFFHLAIFMSQGTIGIL